MQLLNRMRRSDNPLRSKVALFFLVTGLMGADAAIAQSPSVGAKSTGDSIAQVSGATVATNSGTPARPNGRTDDWISDNDYPAGPLRDNVVGLIRFRLTVDTNGLPSACEILGNDNNATLAQTTCELLKKRAHFFPATDATGHPVMGVFSSEVRWQIPDRAHQLLPETTTEIAFDIRTNGTVANCVYKHSGYVMPQMAGIDEKTACKRLGHFVPPVDAAGNPVRKHVVSLESFVVTNVP